MAEAAMSPASTHPADALEQVEQRQEHAMSNGNATAETENSRAGLWQANGSWGCLFRRIPWNVCYCCMVPSCYSAACLIIPDWGRGCIMLAFSR